ncbi:MAG: phosphate signaling complex protein PhoU [Desulfitobacteriaceae bacterium]|nr:phosphate signaling complex protein PhoU [Desulfitobacteriaceae bacterium]MDD4347069.1 phosphate signaling complex protein PhoU [Desulfitobacteriaceae bacterium]MDD4401992.1 phosphate signaling complex protein PhoU [Desulfitobacteriaceae bacterium]
MAVTRQQFDNALEDLRQRILELGTLAEQRIALAVGTLYAQNMETANSIIVGDLELNQLQNLIEEKCILLIATQQPLARDLRKVVAGFKISMHLERMGDLAVNLSKVTIRIGKEKLIKPLIDIPRMSTIVQEMIAKGLTAYIQEDAALAEEMAGMDCEVDDLYAQIFRELLVLMMSDPRTINQANHLLFAAHHMERMGDYCTNIAEEIVYIVRGKRTDLNQ